LFCLVTPAERELKGFSIHGVGGLLKLWLRELPEPVIGYGLYERLLNFERRIQFVSFWFLSLFELIRDSW
jgi:hypothetical protein